MLNGANIFCDFPTRIGNSRFRPGFFPIFENPPKFRQTADAVIRIKKPEQKFENSETNPQTQSGQSKRFYF